MGRPQLLRQHRCRPLCTYISSPTSRLISVLFPLSVKNPSKQGQKFVLWRAAEAEGAGRLTSLKQIQHRSAAVSLLLPP